MRKVVLTLHRLLYETFKDVNKKISYLISKSAMFHAFCTFGLVTPRELGTATMRDGGRSTFVPSMLRTIDVEWRLQLVYGCTAEMSTLE